MIKDGTNEDIEYLLPLAKKMHETSIYRNLDYTDERIRTYAQKFVQSEDHYFRVYIKDEKPTAFFLGYITNYIWSYQILGCEEQLFTDNSSPLVGLKLTKDFEKWCKEKGAVEVNFSVTHSGKPNEKYNKFMERMGYKDVGSIFKKRI
mgnify:FL=1